MLIRGRSVHPQTGSPDRSRSSRHPIWQVPPLHEDRFRRENRSLHEDRSCREGSTIASAIFTLPNPPCWRMLQRPKPPEEAIHSPSTRCRGFRSERSSPFLASRCILIAGGIGGLSEESDRLPPAGRLHPISLGQK